MNESKLTRDLIFGYRIESCSAAGLAKSSPPASTIVQATLAFAALIETDEVEVIESCLSAIRVVMNGSEYLIGSLIVRSPNRSQRMFALDALERVVPELALTEAKWLQHDPVKWVRTTAKEAIEDIMLRDISPGESPIRQGCDDIADLIFVRDGGGEIELLEHGFSKAEKMALLGCLATNDERRRSQAMEQLQKLDEQFAALVHEYIGA